MPQYSKPKADSRDQSTGSNSSDSRLMRSSKHKDSDGELECLRTIEQRCENLSNLLQAADRIDHVAGTDARSSQHLPNESPRQLQLGEREVSGGETELPANEMSPTALNEPVEKQSEGNPTAQAPGLTGQASESPVSSRDYPPGFLLSIVIPVFNEAGTLETILARVRELDVPQEIVIVDDHSSDGTRSILSQYENEPNIHVITKPQNQGKGAALRTGFAQAGGDIIVIQDADLEYNPNDIPALLEPILNDQADVVYGSRYYGERVNDQSRIHRWGNQLLTWASNRTTGLKLTDMETCYKAFRREAIRGLVLEQDRFGFEPEVTAKLARRGYRFVEVPIRYDARGYREGKKIGWRDLLNALFCIWRYGHHE